MDFKNLWLRQAEGLGWITINRPDKLNALNRETIEELIQAFENWRHDEEVLAVILTGAGEKAFVAGADISELARLDESSGREYARRGQELTLIIENYPKPVLAVINGYALGGGTELAMACHLRLASETAKMGQPEVKLGLIPGFGGTQRLARLIGKGRALEVILSGRMVTASEALSWGLVNRVVPTERLMEEAENLAKEIIKNGPLALGLAIEAINRGLDRPLEEALEIEAEIFGQVCATEDAREGTAAFLEKRPPRFRGQ
ncbi:MAG: enoyl-CoA hydratase-related protein [Candidatus Aminicenantes bacterium]|nr:enoyl-CoA hydratase-related protein [Candidatus Aminicenantes bacterium]